MKTIKERLNEEIKLCKTIGTSTDYIFGLNKNEIKISEKIRFLRKRKGFSQEYLAKLLSVTQSTVGKYERNIIVPDIFILIKLRKIFNVTIDFLVGFDN